MQMKTLALALALACSGAHAETVNYEFTGSWNSAGGPLAYTGSFSIVDAAAVQQTVNGLQWEGISTLYSGGTNFNVTFANGAAAHADTFDIRVNNTTQIEAGTPYPLGLSSQFWFNSTISTAGMTAQKICSVTPCGPDDDPLYRRGDSFDMAVRGITGFYMAFYNAPRQQTPALPNYSTDFQGNGLGIYTSAPGANTTSLTDISVTQMPSPVPEPSSYAMMLAGLGVLAFVARRRKV